MEAVSARSESAIEAVSQKANPYAFSQRCTSSVRQAILHARTEADYRRDPLITTCDLLAGLCEFEDTRAERIGNLKSNAGYLRWLTNLPQLPRTEPTVPMSEKRCEFGVEAQRALAYAAAEADRDGEHWIDCDHLLRGLMRFPNRAQSALFNTELTLSLAREASFHDREQYEPEDEPKLTMMETIVGKYVPQLAPRLITAACYVSIVMNMVVAGFQPFFVR